MMPMIRAVRIIACHEFFLHIALLLSGMFCHGIVIDDLLISTIIPIPKSKITA
jgi:hypothetical protein